MTDGTVKIDLLFPANKQKFHSDTELVNDLLKKLGDGAGQHMDDEFDKNAKKMADQSKSTSKQIKDDFKDPVKQKIDGDNKDLDSKVKSSKSKLKGIPKETKTKLLAEAKKAGIDNFGKLLKHLPKKQQTELLAKAQKGEVIDFDDLIKKVPKKYQTEMKLNDNASPGLRNIQEEAQNTGNKFSHLKEIIAGSFLGNALSGAFSAATSGLQSLASEAIQSSDAIFKFKSTMKFGGFGEDEIKGATKEVKKYADDTVYELNDVSNTTAQLAANGIKDYMGLTEAAGNLNAAAGGNADTFKSVAMMLTQTAGAGKLTTENWNQLTDAIPGASGKLQEAMKKNGAYTGNFRDAMAAGQVTSDEFSKAIMQLGQQDGAVKAAKSTQTFEGAVGNMQAEVVSDMDKVIDAFGKKKLTDAIGSVGKIASGAFSLLIKTVAGISALGKSFSGVFDNLKEMFSMFAMSFKSNFLGPMHDEKAAKGLDRIKNRFGDISKALKPVSQAIGGFFGVFIGRGASVASSLLSGIVKGFAGISDKASKAKEKMDFSHFTKTITNMSGALNQVFIELGAVLKPLGEIAAIIAKGAFETFADIAGIIAGKIRDLAGAADKGHGPMNSIAKVLTSLSTHHAALKLVGTAIASIGTAILALKGATKIVSGVTTAIGALPKVITAVSGAFDLLGASMLTNPLAWIVGSIVAVGVAFYELYKHSKKFRNFVNGLVDGAKDAWNGTIKWFKKLGKGIKDIFDNVVDWFKNNWKDIALVIANPIGGAVNLLYKHNKKFHDWANSALKSIKDVFKGIGKWFSGIWDGVVKVAKKGWDGIKKVVDFGAKAVKVVALAPIVVLASMIVSVWNRIKKSTMAFWNWMKSHISSIAKSIKNTATKWFNALKNTISDIWDSISKTTKRIWNPIKKFLINTAKAIKDGVIWVFKTFERGVKTVWNAIKKITHAVWDPIKNFLVNIATQIWHGIVSKFNALKKSISNIWNGVKNTTHNVWNGISGWVVGKAHSIWKGVSGKFNSLKKSISGILGSISKGWHNTWNGMANFFGDIWSSIKKTAKGGINGVIKWLNGGIGGINKVIHTFGGSKNAIGKIKKLATGGSGYRGIAMVNDGGGEEAIIKGGHAYKVQGKNAYVNLEGDETVVPHGASRAMFGDSIVHYAGGSKNWFSNLTGWFKDKWDGIVSFIKHPLKSLENIMSKAMGAVSGSELVTKLAPALGKGLVRGIEAPFKKLLQKLKDKHDEEDEGSASGPNAKPTGDHKHWMKQAGFKPGDYSAINWIVNHESGWRVNATNGSSGAYGLPQSLPGSKMASAGTDWKTNPITQLKWMKSYVKGRYGSAAAAKRFWEKHNWYENGGFADKPSIFGEKGLEAAVPLSAEKADQGYAMLGKSAAYMAQRDSLTISNGQTNGRLDKVEQGLSQAVLLLNQINTTGKDNVKATYATAFDKKAIYNQMALDQSLASYPMGGA